MKLLKTKFYPVDGDAKIIYDDPFDAERLLAHAYKGKRPIGYKMSHLLKEPVYRTFTFKPSSTLPSMIAEWQQEEATSQHLWRGAAAQILHIIQNNEINEALAKLKAARPKQMAINCFYDRAIQEMKYLLKWLPFPEGVALENLVKKH